MQKEENTWLVKEDIQWLVDYLFTCILPNYKQRFATRDGLSTTCGKSDQPADCRHCATRSNVNRIHRCRQLYHPPCQLFKAGCTTYLALRAGVLEKTTAIAYPKIVGRLPAQSLKQYNTSLPKSCFTGIEVDRLEGGVRYLADAHCTGYCLFLV